MLQKGASQAQSRRVIGEERWQTVKGLIVLALVLLMIGIVGVVYANSVNFVQPATPMTPLGIAVFFLLVTVFGLLLLVAWIWKEVAGGRPDTASADYSYQGAGPANGAFPDQKTAAE